MKSDHRMRLTIKNKILVLAVASVSVPVLVIMLLLINFRSGSAENSYKQINELATDNIRQATQDVYSMLKITDDFMQDRLARNMKLLDTYLASKGRFSLGNEYYSWTANISGTTEKKVVEIPKFMIGNVWLGSNQKLSVPTEFVDAFKKSSGADLVIYQRLNESGDMIAVASSISADNLNRYTGTIISSFFDGVSDPVIQEIIKGKEKRGILYTEKGFYFTGFRPIVSESGTIIGMIGVAEDLVSQTLIDDKILSSKIGSSGYVAIVAGDGSHRGSYVLSEDGARNGEKIIDLINTEGKRPVREMLDLVKGQPQEEVFLYHYTWRNIENDTESKKIAACLYYKDWDWLIVTNVTEKEHFAPLTAIKDEFSSLITLLLIASFVILILAAGISSWASRKISTPIQAIIRMTELIAQGKFELAARVIRQQQIGGTSRLRRVVDSEDEISDLLIRLENMIHRLEQLLLLVEQQRGDITKSTTGINGSARTLEATVSEQAASIREVTSTTKIIAQTSDNLLSTIENALKSVVRQTADKASSAHEDISLMAEAVHSLKGAAESITAKLSTINERANKISDIVVTIDKISDQTNLLSLNAAIEAEKAGEFGKGFSVVAREISRLADQTSVATGDIERMISEMQSSVASGVMEMDKFNEEVKRNSSIIGTLGERISEITEHAEELRPHFESIREGMSTQTESAFQISEAMQQLTVAAEQTKESLEEFKDITKHLDESTLGLQATVTQFRSGD